MTRTHTRTHVSVSLANPFLICGDCRLTVTAWHDPDHCGCEGGAYNLPCEHQAAISSICPSWGPVDGCRCQQPDTDHRQMPRGFGRSNPHCVRCGDERGGPYGHETSECQYRSGMTADELAATMPPEKRALYWATLVDRYLAWKVGQ